MPWSFFDSNGNQLTKQRGTLAIVDGGTGGITAAAALEALGVGPTDSPTFTTLTLNTGLVPDANDGAYLGTSSVGFSDLFLASGAVLNFANGNMTITHSSTTLTVAGGTFATAALTATTIQGTQVDITAQGDLRLQDSTGGQYVAFQAAGTTTTHTLTFPAAVATTAGDMLTSSTGGVLSWTTPSAGVGLGLVIALGG